MGKEMTTLIFALISCVFAYGIATIEINVLSQLMIVIPICIINGAIASILENSIKKGE